MVRGSNGAVQPHFSLGGKKGICDLLVRGRLVYGVGICADEDCRMWITAPERWCSSEEAGAGSVSARKPTMSCVCVGVVRYANSQGRSAVSGVAVHDGIDAAGSVDRWK